MNIFKIVKVFQHCARVTRSLAKSSQFQGYTHPREYIVTEWPLTNTCSDLWSLVYDHDCSAVVVLCNPAPGIGNVNPDLK